MDRSSLLRIVGIALLVFVSWKWIGPMMGMGEKSDAAQNLPPETYVNAPGFVPDDIDPVAGDPSEGTLCKIKGSRFDAVLSTRGAAVAHFFLRDPQYAGTEGLDMSTTDKDPKRAVERWRSLRTLFRGDKGFDQVKFDRFNWTLEETDGKSCHFSYTDDTVHIDKVIAADARPFELTVSTTLTNLSPEPHRHELSIEMFAYRQNEEVKSHLGRVSPFVTELSCARGEDVTRKSKDDFKSGWFSIPLDDRYAAIANYYFAQALVPVKAPEAAKPACELLAEDWLTSTQQLAGLKRDDDKAGDVYHARLTYPSMELAPHQTATYEQIALFGPKERDVLAKAAGGSELGNGSVSNRLLCFAHLRGCQHDEHPAPGLGDLINLGFFSPVAKVLVGVLVFFHAHVTFGNWGLAIVAMTLCLRVLLLPLSLKPVRTAIAMRKLKPEIDALTLKFKDDMQAKNMATMELYRKHGVNPLGGCLPQLVQMPIWFAMYTTLQTAVEMYHEKFLWFSDLSAPDKLYILPLVLGGFMILQQKIVPQQGMDPVQAKMMMYLLPLVFTGMMLFLPAALGVYMLTTSVLGIVQQLVIERIAPRGGPAGGSITVKSIDKDGALSGSFGKGKARV